MRSTTETSRLHGEEHLLRDAHASLHYALTNSLHEKTATEAGSYEGTPLHQDLEEFADGSGGTNIPVGLIVGTSAGSIIGALYARPLKPLLIVYFISGGHSTKRSDRC